jgi:hypothetical protein
MEPLNRPGARSAPEQSDAAATPTCSETALPAQRSAAGAAASSPAAGRIDTALSDLLRGIRGQQTNELRGEAARRGPAQSNRIARSASGTGKLTMHLRSLANCLGFGPDHMAAHFLPCFWDSEMPEEYERALSAALVLRYKQSGRIEDEEARVWSAMFDQHVAAGVHEGALGIGYLQCRTRYFDDVVAAHAQMEQLVLLGAGFDTRCYRLDRPPRRRCFELDAPTTQAEKREALGRAGIDARHVAFVAVDFARDDWMALLVDAGFDPALPTLFVWEVTRAASTSSGQRLSC